MPAVSFKSFAFSYIFMRDIVGEAPYTGQELDEAMLFLELYHKDKYFDIKSWPRPECMKVGLSIRTTGAGGNDVDRKGLASALEMSVRDVDRHIRQLRSYNLVEPRMPYRTTKHFDEYMKSLIDTAKVGCRIIRLV